MPKNELKIDLLEKIVSLCKRRGFIYPGSSIYGGFVGTYDLGPYGVALRRNLVDAWKEDIQEEDSIAFIESSIFTSRKVWEASGHVGGFSDPLVVCNSCHTKQRDDHLLESIGAFADEKMTEKKINEVFDAHRKELT